MRIKVFSTYERVRKRRRRIGEFTREITAFKKELESKKLNVTI